MRYKSIKFRLATCFMSLFIASTPIISSAAAIYNPDSNMVPTGKGWGIKSDHAPKVVNNPLLPQNGIFFHGGPVMGTSATATPNIYIIWYGNWAGNSAVNIISNLARGIGASPYYKINTTYQDAAGAPVLPKANFVCGIYDNYSLGKSLADSSIYYIITNAIKAKRLPADNNGVYFVMTAADVNLTSGMCTSYCGWHTGASFSFNNQSFKIKYSVVGNTDRCPRSCAGQSTVSPNNNIAADGMASIWAHELEEAVTDPLINAWYDTVGYENADKCAWKWGTTQNMPNGAKYNMTINNMNFLIQQNWVNANGGYCASSY